MAKLTNLTIAVRNEYKDEMVFTTPVSVTTAGLFTTTLPEEVVTKFDQYGVQLGVGRRGRRGYFESDSLEKLKGLLRETALNALSRELIEEKEVIRYQVVTSGACCIDKDLNIFPNGIWNREDFERGVIRWAKFNCGDTVMHPRTPGIRVYAEVQVLRRFRFKNGKEVVDYMSAKARPTSEDRSCLNWLKSHVAKVPSNESFYNIPIREIPATEKNAEFFVRLLELVYKAAAFFGQFDEPERLETYIESHRLPALPDFTDEQQHQT